MNSWPAWQIENQAKLVQVEIERNVMHTRWPRSLQLLRNLVTKFAGMSKIRQIRLPLDIILKFLQICAF